MIQPRSDLPLVPFLDVPWVRTTLGLVALLAAVLLLHVVGRRLVLAGLRALVERSRVHWDEILFEHRVPQRLSLVVPLIALQLGIVLVPGMAPAALLILDRVIGASFVVVAALTADALLGALQALYARTRMAATRPIKSYVQLAKVLVYLVAFIFVVARLAGQSPWLFVSGLGAMMAIILIIFRDTLLSLVASVQITNNDLVRVGDWIEMPQFGADGDVIDIALTAVRVRNWDRTTAVIPTHKFLDNSFRNWRGMFESGGRRIKRAIHVNIATIRFLTPEEVARFRRFVLLRDYVDTKLGELALHNERWADDPQAIVNARRLTNIGTLRAYIIAYLRSRPDVRQDMTFLVRQLAPTPEGLPLEIYVFTADTRWAFYEAIQADIFDHVLSMVPEFGLSVYQRPSGRDLDAAALEEEVPGARREQERAAGAAAGAPPAG